MERTELSLRQTEHTRVNCYTYIP